jgi:tripartite-type tricarboxylate transporter receptor subunit TctC
MNRFLRTLLATCALAALPLAAAAQGYPKGPITIVIPLAAGDGGDTTLRAMTDDLSRQLQVPIVVANRPGAGGAVGVQSVVTAKKDGYTLLFTQNSPLTIRRVLEPQAVTYDPLKDLVPLAITTRTPSILVVRKDAPFTTFQEMVAHAKKNPGSLRIGSAGQGSAGELSVHVINTVAGTDLTPIPYKGAAPAVTDVLGGQVEGVILALGALSAHIKSGALKPIAISSRHPELPDVPTLTRLGYRQDMLGIWFGFFAPAGVPAEVTQALGPALQKAAENKAVADRLLPMGIVLDYEPAAKLAEQVSTEYEAIGALHQRMQAGKK